MAAVRNPGVVYRPLADEGGVLLHLETGSYHGLNPTGALIWSLLDGARDTTAVAGALRAECTNVPDDLEDAVGRFLADLAARGLVADSGM
jgi:hypothetical protein